MVWFRRGSDADSTRTDSIGAASTGTFARTSSIRFTLVPSFEEDTKDPILVFARRICLG